MQSQPQPIASHARDIDYNMAGSYTGAGASGSFNPASYTRHFLGSPLSWRQDVLGSQMYPQHQYSSSIQDQSDLKRMSTSVESDRGAFYNAISAFDREGDLCRNYTCCGLHLNDLHALLEHFEEVHVVVIDPNPSNPNPQTQVQIPFNPQPAPDMSQHQQQQLYLQHQQQQAQSLSHSQQTLADQIGPFDPDDMDIGLDSSLGASSSRTPSSGAPTPPETPVSTPQFSSYSNPNLNLNTQTQFNGLPSYHSQPSSPSLISAFETTAVVPRAFLGAGPYGNPYLPSLGNSSSLANANGPSPHIKSNLPSNDQGACGVPPALLFSSSSGRHHSGNSRTISASAHVTPNPSRVPSPSGHYSNSSPPSPTHVSGDKSSGLGRSATTASSRPSTSMLLSKPFRCPKPNCNKSYKQANGLKYHLTHGSCSFTPAREVEQVQALLAARTSSGASGTSTPGSPAMEHTEEEILEVEKEAERNLKPYACGVADCQRRYKNMNGLRYHYQHTGDHGAIGLALLASGQHEACARNGQSGVGSRERRAGGSRAPSRANTPPNGMSANQGHSVSGMNGTSSYAAHGQQPYPTAHQYSPPAFGASLQQQQQQRQAPVAMPVQMGFGSRYDLTTDVSMGLAQ